MEKLNISKMEYFLMAFLAYPVAVFIIVLAALVWVDILGHSLC